MSLDTAERDEEFIKFLQKCIDKNDPSAWLEFSLGYFWPELKELKEAVANSILVLALLA